MSRSPTSQVTLKPGVKTMLAPFSADGSYLSVSVSVAVAALTGFEVWGKSDPNAVPVLLASLSAEYTAPAFLDRVARSDASSTDLTTIPAGVTGQFGVDTHYYSEIQVFVTSAGAAVVSSSAGAK